MRVTMVVVAASLLAATGCKNDPVRPDAQQDAQGADPDAADLWWTPRPGETVNWDIQLAAPYDLSAARDLYVLDLWAVSPATTLDYGDGAPVAVPAGPQAGAIAMLHARTPRPYVACYVRTGAVHLTADPDAMKFPGYAADPPNRPDPVAASSAIAWDTATRPVDTDERFLDIRASARAAWQAIVWKRLAHADAIGCDAVAVDYNSQLWASSSPGLGYDLFAARADQLSWYQEVASQAHALELSVGHVNGLELAGEVDQFAAAYDWLLVERCAVDEVCDQTRPLLNQGKAVFAFDYASELSATNACQDYAAAMIQEALLKDDAVSSATREICAL